MAGENNSAGGQDPNAEGGDGGQDPKSSDVQAQIDALKAGYEQTLADLRKENANRRAENKTLREQLQKGQETKGEFEPLYKQTLAEKQALEAEAAKLKEKADRFDAEEADRRKALEARAAKLPPEEREIVLAIPSMAKALIAAEKFEKARAPAKPPEPKKQKPDEGPPNLGTPPPGQGTVDFFAVRDKAELRKLIAEHPAEWEKLNGNSSGRPQSFIAGLFGKK